MRSRKGLRASLTLTIAAAVAALFVAAAQGAGTPTTLSFVAQNQGREFLTAAGPSSVWPGRLQPGDRILSRDALLQRDHSVGYGDELCTVTVDNHFLCQVMVVLPGEGQIQVSWLELHWPDGYTGVIDGGTGHFANAKGTFTYTQAPNGIAKITVRLK
jgi:hypothetical protein